MPVIAMVRIYDSEEKLPKPRTMILADDGEWHILLYEQGSSGHEWEDDTQVEFSRWCNLGDLDAGGW